jgi:hypothetical protein
VVEVADYVVDMMFWNCRQAMAMKPEKALLKSKARVSK